MTDLAHQPESAPVSPVHPGRLKLLVLAHVLASPAPAVAFLLPPDMRYLPLIWLGSSVLVAQLMLLAVWLGLGSGAISVRLVTSAVGCAWAAWWACLPQIVLQDSAERYPFILSTFLGCVAIWAGVFLAVRRYSAELRLAMQSSAVSVRRPSQFSILHILIVTAVVAIVLGLARGAEATREDGSGWNYWVATALTLVTFFINLYCAVWATLGEARVGWRLCLVLVVALLLGVAVALTSNIQLLGWWLFAALVLAMSAPTAIVAASLLVVRSCGYRLVPKGGDPAVHASA